MISLLKKLKQRKKRHKKRRHTSSYIFIAMVDTKRPELSRSLFLIALAGRKSFKKIIAICFTFGITTMTQKSITILQTTKTKSYRDIQMWGTLRARTFFRKWCKWLMIIIPIGLISFPKHSLFRKTRQSFWIINQKIRMQCLSRSHRPVVWVTILFSSNSWEIFLILLRRIW